MPEIVDLYEFFSAVAVIIIISFFVAVAWISTYVRDQPVVATAVVVFQQEPSANRPTSEVRPPIMNRTARELSPRENVIHNSEEEQHMSASTVAEDVDAEEFCESTPTSDSDESEKENKSEASDKSSSIDENYSRIPEEGSCSTSVAVGRKRQQERTNSDKVPVSASTENSSHASSSNFKASASEINKETEVVCEEILQDAIRIKIRFVDDTQRMVRCQLSDEVGSFKRANFDTELTSNCVVRLIFNGQLLTRDRSTLGQYGLFDNCVVHCHVSQPQPLNSTERGVTPENEELDLSEILSPMLLVILAVLWYLRYEYAHIFNTSSTIILGFLTALLLISQFAFTVNLEFSMGYGNDRRPASGSPRRPASGSSGRSTLGSPRPATDSSEPRIERNSRPASGSSRRPALGSPRPASDGSEPGFECNSNTVHPPRPSQRTEKIPSSRTGHQSSDGEPFISLNGSNTLASDHRISHTSLSADEASFTGSNHRPMLDAIHVNG